MIRKIVRDPREKIMYFEEPTLAEYAQIREGMEPKPEELFEVDGNSIGSMWMSDGLFAIRPEVPYHGFDVLMAMIGGQTRPVIVVPKSERVDRFFSGLVGADGPFKDDCYIVGDRRLRILNTVCYQL